MQEIKYQNLTIKLDEERRAYVIVECEKDAVHVDIPLKINDCLFGGIDSFAFADCDLLESVTFPSEEDFYLAETDFITECDVGSSAFACCTSLTQIDLPCYVTCVWDRAFRDCISLKEVYVPDCYVGSYAFYNCESLEKINPIRYIAEGVFSDCKSLKVFPVADGAKEIGEDAFQHCYGLVDITIPASVKEIGQLAFRSCRNLKTVTFQNTQNWVWHCFYDGKNRPIDVTNPEENAYSLSRADFDDGCQNWHVKDNNDGDSRSDTD